MKGPKVVLIGAGSLFFGRQLIRAMSNRPVFDGGTMALVDTNAERLDRMMALARQAIDYSDNSLRLEGSTDHRQVLADADFVILSFANEGVYYRGIDCAIAAKYGVRMCSGDTIGPGGIFRAMRELPVILAVAKDIEQICPEAWVINYINPTAVNGTGLMRHTNVKSFALCDGLHMPHVKQKYLEAVGGTDLDTLDLSIAGVNHCTWLLDIRYDGQDATEQLRQTIAERAAKEKNEGHPKSRFNDTYGLMLWEIFGKWPDCMSHTKEYVPYWQGRGVLSDHPASLSVFDVSERYQRHEAMWKEVADYIAGRRTMGEFMDSQKPDHATDVIEAMWSNSGMPFYINVANGSAVPNLPHDACLELLCDIDMNGPVPRAVPSFPRGLRALQMQIIDTHELTVEAIVHNDRALLRRAMLTDPIVNSISDADALIAELLEAQRAALPAEWYH